MAGLFKIFSQNHYRGFFKAWKAQMKQTVAVNRNYFERDKVYTYIQNLMKYTLENIVI
jgi:hypothetical protein